MAWSYAAYELEANDTARLAMLRQHIAEVEAKIDQSVSASDKSVDRSVLETKMTRLNERRRELEEILGQGNTSPGVLHADFRGS